mgnify:FL=1
MLNKIYLVGKDWGWSTLFEAIINSLKSSSLKLIGKRFVKKKIYNYELWLDLNDAGISRGLMLFGQREMEHKIMLEKVLKQGMTIYDIGANIGYYVCMERGLIGDNGRVVAIEPSPTNIDLLRKNIELNGLEGVDIFQLAIGDKVSNEQFHLSTQSNLNTFHNTGSGVQHLSGETIEVEMVTVPELVKRTGLKPDLIRMDVEGHEVEVINGMLDEIALGNISPMIIFETHLTRYSEEHSIEKTLIRMFELGYKIKMVGSSRQSGTRILEQYGYSGGNEISTDGVVRKIFEDIKCADAIEMISKKGGIRTVLLVKE